MNVNKLTLSIVIPTKNRHEDLRNCIDSFVTQSRMPEELIIIDQSDNEVIKLDIENKIKVALPEIKLIYVWDRSIKGLIEAKEKGVIMAESEIVMFLEDDVILTKNYVENIEKAFLDKPEMIGCCGVIKFMPKRNVLYSILFKIFHTGIYFDPRFEVHGSQETQKLNYINSAYLSGGLSAYKIEVFDKVKFDTKNSFFMYEDIDFSTRASDIFGKNKFYIVTTAILDHVMSPTNRAVLGKKYKQKLFECTLFYKKHKKKNKALIHYLWLITGMILELFYESIRNLNFKIMFSGISGLYKGIFWKLKEL